MNLRTSGNARNALCGSLLAIITGAIAYLTLSQPPQAAPAVVPAVVEVKSRPVQDARPAPNPAPFVQKLSEPAPEPVAQPAQPDDEAAPQKLASGAVLKQRVGSFQQKMADYRASQPVFANFINFLDDVLLPLAQRGTDAYIELQKLQVNRNGIEMEDTQKVIAAHLAGVASEALAMAEAGRLFLNSGAGEQLHGIIEYAQPDGNPSLENPYSPGTADYYNYDLQLGLVAATAARSMFFDILQYASPELEEERDFLSIERTRLGENDPECHNVSVDADAYEDLIRERLQYLGDLSTWAASVNRGEPAGATHFQEEAGSF